MAGWIAITVSHVVWFVYDLRQAKEVQRVQVGLRRLAALSVRNFPDRNLNDADLFWKAIGREKPMRDPWGTEFRVEGKEGRRYFWRSAGPDGRWDTADDLAVEIPFVDSPGLSPDLLNQERDLPPASSAQ